VIWLLRHGDAEEGTPDSERKPTQKGEQQARIAGAALARLGVTLDACLASPKLRAAEMARLACERLKAEVTLEPALAGGPFHPTELAAGRSEVLLVGHDPDLSQAVRDMTGARVQMKKGAVAGIEGNELRVLLRPQELEALAS
jgi:phosphohistidine phosphatase